MFDRNPVRFFLSQESPGEVLASTKGAFKEEIMHLVFNLWKAACGVQNAV